MKQLSSLLALLLLLSCTSQKPQTLIVGTVGSSSGIYIYDFNETEHNLVSKSDIANPTFMSFNRAKSSILSVSETEKENSAVIEYSYNNDDLTQLSSEPCSGAYPCHIAQFGKFVATANYGGGNISLFRGGKRINLIEFNTPNNPNPSHLHCIIPSPDGKYMFATDLGKDSIYRFKIEENNISQLYPSVSVKEGSGPRHLTFNHKGNRAYLINEMAGTVIGFNYSNGDLNQFQSIVSDSIGGRGSADIHLSRDDKFLYASNRLKADGISIFSVNPANGELTKIGYTLTGKHPRNFTLSPDEKLLLVACRDENAIQIYKRDKESGLLEYTGKESDIKVDSPMYVRFW